jgi:peptide/nickel transport system substrate-binding protein
MHMDESRTAYARRESVVICGVSHRAILSIQRSAFVSKEVSMKARWFMILCCVAVLILGSRLSWAQQPKYGGTLRVALPGELTFFNAHQGPAPGSNTFWVSNNIFNSLVSLTPPPDFEVVPELAKSWEVLDGGRTYVFHLREGVSFHDGTDFDAHAAKWNFDRILNPAVNSWVRPYYEEVDQVEAVDKHTLRVRMKEPSGALLTALAGYFQGIQMASPKSFETYGEEWVRHPTGTGPYKLAEWIPGEHVTLEKNPSYFKQGLPYLDTIEFRMMKDPYSPSAALRAGEIDFIARVPIQQVFILENSPGIQVVTGAEMAPVVALLNMRVKPFDDVRVRRAVGGYGIDRFKIAKLGFGGRAQPLVSVLASGVPDAIDLNDMYPYHPDESRRQLKELGFDEANPLQLTILVPNHDPTLSDIAALIANQLEKVGVKSQLILLDAMAWVERVLVGHDFEMVVSNWARLLDINMRSVSFFKGGASNYTGINDPKLEAMVRQWRRALDPEARKHLSADMQRLIAEQLYWINVTGYPVFQAYRRSVQNYPFDNQASLFLEQVWLEK